MQKTDKSQEVTEIQKALDATSYLTTKLYDLKRLLSNRFDPKIDQPTVQAGLISCAEKIAALDFPRVVFHANQHLTQLMRGEVSALPNTMYQLFRVRASLYGKKIVFSALVVAKNTEDAVLMAKDRMRQAYEEFTKNPIPKDFWEGGDFTAIKYSCPEIVDFSWDLTDKPNPR